MNEAVLFMYDTIGQIWLGADVMWEFAMYTDKPQEFDSRSVHKPTCDRRKAGLQDILICGQLGDSSFSNERCDRENLC